MSHSDVLKISNTAYPNKSLPLRNNVRTPDFLQKIKNISNNLRPLIIVRTQNSVTTS